MTLRDYLSSQNIDTQDILFVSVATDGLSFNKNKIMAVTYKPYGSDHVSIFIDGANASAVSSYTGISATHYAKSSTHPRTASLALRQLFDKTKLVVSYAVPKFTLPWLTTLSDDFSKELILDVTNYAKLLDKGQNIPEDVEDLTDLTIKLEEATLFNKTSFVEYVNRYVTDLSDLEDLSELEKKPYLVERLFIALLDKEN